MKRRLSRADAEKILINDPYFSKGHFRQRIFQTFVAFLGWCGLILPFLWLLFPLVFPERADLRHFVIYEEEKTTLLFLLIFLSISFVFLLIFYITLTFWNNHRFKNHLQKKEQYDVEQVKHRRDLLEKAYEERFGSKEFRENVCYYVVSKEQNLETDFIQKLYQKGEKDV